MEIEFERSLLMLRSKPVLDPSEDLSGELERPEPGQRGRSEKGAGVLTTGPGGQTWLLLPQPTGESREVGPGE